MSLIRITLYLLYLLFFSFFIVEIIFRFLPVSDSLKYQTVNNESPIMHFLPNRTITAQIGFDFSHVVQKKINNYGYFSDFDYKPTKKNEKSIAIIGDSYVEALQLPNNKSIGGLLTQIYDPEYVYSIGWSGSPLTQYLAFAEWAEDELNPETFVFLIISNDFYESSSTYIKHVGMHHYDEDMDLKRVDYEVSSLKRFLQNSAFLRYLIIDLKLEYQLRNFLQRFDKTNNTQNSKADIKDESENKKLLKNIIENFIFDLADITKDKEVIFVLDGDRHSIYSGGKYKQNDNINYAYSYFKEYCCDKKNFSYIDLHVVFKKNYEKYGKKFNFDSDYHWNELGHSIAFQEIKKLITR